MAFDYSLAARTFAFRIDSERWDVDWIRHFGLSERLFPKAHPAGTAIGQTVDSLELGIAPGTPVAIAGHDHVCASLSVGAIVPGRVYDSMGTAETLVGTLGKRTLTRHDFESGLSFGCHIAPGKLFWMGGNSQSGGSVEWLRAQLADETLSYETLLALLANRKPDPTGVLYYPYLAGSGAPQPDATAKAALIGFTKNHGKADLIAAFLEGTAYQLEAMREVAEAVSGESINRLLVVGGGTRNPSWLQIKADVSGCRLELPPIEEATMLGAALAAGVGSGVFGSMEEAAGRIANLDMKSVEPHQARHAVYRDLYVNGYKALQQPLRAFYKG